MRSTPRSIPRTRATRSSSSSRTSSRAPFPKRTKRPQEGRQVLRPAARADFPRAGDQGPPPSRRPQVRPDSRYLDRSRSAAAHSRLGHLYPRRDPGAGHHHAWHRRRHAASGSLRRRSQEALHAALQLPAVLGGRSRIPARSRPPRDWARRTGRARFLGGAAVRSRLAVRHARRLRHSGVERIVVDGHGLRSFAQHDGCWRSAEGLGCRSCHGAGEGRQRLRHPHRHRRRRRSLRRHGLQGRRHSRWHHRAADGHQGDGHHAADHARGAGAGPPRTSVHPRQDERSDRASRAPRSANLRPASTPCRFRPTRSATSSGRAAR